MGSFEVIIITGASIDGKITIKKNASSKKFAPLLTSEMSKPLTELRVWADAVLVGRKTVELDNPSLKSIENSNLIRVVIDRKMQLPTNKKIFDGSVSTFVFATKLKKKKQRTLKKRNIEVIKISQEYFLPQLREQLIKRGVYKIMIEGGGSLNYLLLKNNFVDKIVIAYFPFIVGGNDTPTVVDGKRIASVKKISTLKLIKSYVVDKDMVVNEYRIIKC